MIVLNAKDVRKALPMDKTIAAIKRAYAALSDGRAELPQRLSLNVPPHEGVSLIMAAFVQDEEREALALKVVSVFPNNARLELPILQAAVLVLESNTARPVALLEGGALTAIRTGGASGAATDLLARQESSKVAIFGAGVQGRTQLEAVCTVRPIETAWIYDRSEEKVEVLLELTRWHQRLRTQWIDLLRFPAFGHELASIQDRRPRPPQRANNHAR